MIVNPRGALNRKTAWYRTAIFIIVLIAVEFFIYLAAMSPIFNLSGTSNQLAEVSKIAGLLVTVEGILLGLSPILFDKVGKKILGAVSVTFTGFALAWSLSTIVVADTATSVDIAVKGNYWLDLILFGIVVMFYIASVWDTWLEQAQK